MKLDELRFNLAQKRAEPVSPEKLKRRAERQRLNDIQSAPSGPAREALAKARLLGGETVSVIFDGGSAEVDYDVVVVDPSIMDDDDRRSISDAVKSGEPIPLPKGVDVVSIEIVPKPFPLSFIKLAFDHPGAESGS